MIPIPTLPQAIVVALPLLVTLITGLLGHEALPAWVNALIAGLFIIGGAVLSIALGQGFTGNLALDFILFAGYSAALVSSPMFKPLLDKLLASTPSPLTALFKQAEPLITTTTSQGAVTATQPKPIELPTVTEKTQPPGDSGG